MIHYHHLILQPPFQMASNAFVMSEFQAQGSSSESGIFFNCCLFSLLTLEHFLSLSFMTLSSERLQVSYFVEWPPIWVVWCFLIVIDSGFAFGTGLSLSGSSVFSLPPVGWYRISVFAFIVGVHIDHSIRVGLSAFSMVKLSFSAFVICKYFLGGSFKLHISFLIKLSVFMFLYLCGLIS